MNTIRQRLESPRATKVLRHTNTVLSVGVFLLAVHIIFMPFLPTLQVWANERKQQQRPLVAANKPDATQAQVAAEQIPAENTLVIPKLGLQEVVHESKTAEALRHGIWHRPHTSTPDAGGNTVLVGHRFSYAQPRGVFYSLDKVAVNDSLVVYWEGKKYVYTVQEITVVPPTAVAVEAPTDQSVLTVYTCTPLWSGKDRLVLRATLDGEQS